MKNSSVTTFKGVFGKYIPYSLGLLQDSMPYNFINFYLLIFMTDMVGISPALGGAIIFISAICNAVANPTIGYISDNFRSKYGRRRPFILGTIIPIFCIMILLFAPVEIPNQFKFIYYLILTVIFWIIYTLFSIPFNSFGAEVATETNERTNLRTICGIFTYIGVWFATAGPMFMQSILEGTSVSEKTTWFYSAILFGIIGACGALICGIFTKGKEKIIDYSDIPKKSGLEAIKDLFLSYGMLLKTRVVRLICLVALVYNIFFAVKATGFVYLMTHNLELNSGKQALFWSIAAVINFASLPILRLFANRISKKATFIITWSILACFAVVFFFAQITSFQILVAYQLIFALGNVCFWVIGYSLAYDCVEVVEFKHGENKSGGIIGIYVFCQTAGYAVGGWIAGISLSLTGYNADAAVQSESVKWGINAILTGIPAVILTIGIILMIRFPINRINHQKLCQALKDKKEGKPYSTDGFEKLL